MKLAYFKSYFAGESSYYVEITDEEYTKIKPFECDLNIGNSPNEFFDLIWDDMQNRPHINNPDLNLDCIVIAVC